MRTAFTLFAALPLAASVISYPYTDNGTTFDIIDATHLTTGASVGQLIGFTADHVYQIQAGDGIQPRALVLAKSTATNRWALAVWELFVPVSQVELNNFPGGIDETWVFAPNGLILDQSVQPVLGATTEVNWIDATWTLPDGSDPRVIRSYSIAHVFSPEPATVGLAGLALAMLAWRRRA